MIDPCIHPFIHTPCQMCHGKKRDERHFSYTDSDALNEDLYSDSILGIRKRI